jgi:hypothetical protein
LGERDGMDVGWCDRLEDRVLFGFVLASWFCCCTGWNRIDWIFVDFV